MSVEKFNSPFGGKSWKSTIRIPIEQVQDKDFLAHIKRELKERCVKEYISNVEDSFKYTIHTDRVGWEAEVSIYLEDLFGLKEQNKRLHREIVEVLDMYKSLKNEHRRSR